MIMSDNAGTLNIQNVDFHMGKASASGAMTFAKVPTRQMSSQGMRRSTFNLIRKSAERKSANILV